MYYTVAGQDFELPYLPDPWAIGIAVAVFGTEGQTPTSVQRVPFLRHRPDPRCLS